MVNKFKGYVNSVGGADTLSVNNNGNLSEPLTITDSYRYSIDRLEVTDQDTNKTINKELEAKYPNHYCTGLVHNFLEDGDVKVSYTRYKAKKPGIENPWTNIEIHDVEDFDQLFLSKHGKRQNLKIVEIANDFFPSQNSSCDEISAVINYGLYVKNVPGASFSCYGGPDKYTLYHGHNCGMAHEGPKGLRIYHRPKKGISKYVRVEVEPRGGMIKKLGLTLPVSPQSFLDFPFVEYRHPCQFRKLAKRLANKDKPKFQGRRPLAFQAHIAVLDTWLEYRVNQEYVKAEGKKPNTWTPYDWRPAVAAQIDNFKEECPDLAPNWDDFFPKWEGRKEQLRQLLENTQEGK